MKISKEKIFFLVIAIIASWIPFLVILLVKGGEKSLAVTLCLGGFVTIIIGVALVLALAVYYEDKHLNPRQR